MQPPDRMSVPQGVFQLNLYPRRKRETLRAWDAADEYALHHIHRENSLRDRDTLLILNDGFGALSVALAEARPIIVLDEFAADQDPVRRKLFYDVLVPQMARDGHLVIAVTHDEHCFDKCDRLIRMEAGRILADTRQPGAAHAMADAASGA